FNGTVLVLYADTPLIKPATIKSMLKTHTKKKASATLLTVKTDDPKEYGRIQRDKKGRICGIVEHTDILKNTQYAIRNTQYQIKCLVQVGDKVKAGLTPIVKYEVRKTRQD
ncbi:MAG: sugar phosphate nucleotidyltransferase, partial [Sedimentisphaerales bacterium]|nr:sugar phosphate nucleotidyltransferase [Sedimentisphaerales bacterium]